MKFEVTGKQALYYLLLLQFVITAVVFMIMMPAFHVGISAILKENEAYEFGIMLYLAWIKMGLFFWVMTVVMGILIYFFADDKEEPPRKQEPPQTS